MSRGLEYDGAIMDIAQALRHRRAARAGRHRRLHGGPAADQGLLPGRARRPQAAPLPQPLQDGRGAALSVLDPLPPGALRGAERHRPRRAVRRRAGAAARRAGGRGLRGGQARPEGRRGARRVRHVHDLRRGGERGRDERGALPARGPRRRLPAAARHREGPGRSPTTTSSCPRGSLADRLRPSSTATSAARPGSRTSWPMPSPAAARRRASRDRHSEQPRRAGSPHHEGRHLLRRAGHAAARVLGVDPQAHGAASATGRSSGTSCATTPTSGTRTSSSASATRPTAIKKYFLDYDETVSNDFVMSEGGKKVDLLASDIQDWKITFVDTGMTPTSGSGSRRCSRSSRARRCSSPTTATGCPTCRCRHMIDYFRRARTRWPASPGVAPTQSFHLVQRRGRRAACRASGTSRTCGMRINGGFFVLRREIFDYMKDGRGAGRGALPAPGRRAASCWPTRTTASGPAWTPSRTSSSSRTSTPAGRCPGRSGSRSRRERRTRPEPRSDAEAME